MYLCNVYTNNTQTRLFFLLCPAAVAIDGAAAAVTVTAVAAVASDAHRYRFGRGVSKGERVKDRFEKNIIQRNNISPYCDRTGLNVYNTSHTMVSFYSINIGDKCAVGTSYPKLCNILFTVIHSILYIVIILLTLQKKITLTFFNFHCSAYIKQNPKPFLSNVIIIIFNTVLYFDESKLLKRPNAIIIALVRAPKL